MRVKSLKAFFSNNKRIKILLAIFIIVGGFFVFLYFFLFINYPVHTIFVRALDVYQGLVENIANIYLKSINTGISIKDHVVMLDNKSFAAIENGILFKKWTLILLIIIWLTPAKTFLKMFFTIILFILLFILLPIGCSIIAYYITFNSDMMEPYRIGKTIPLIGLITFLLIWLQKNRIAVKSTLKKYKILNDIVNSKKTAIIILLYFSAILNTYIIGYFYFEPWVNFIFNISKWGLNMLGYYSEVVPFYLYGENALIFMSKSCLGLMTMLLFASVVYLTGYNDRKTWLFIFFGVVLLNIVNILRFILLYIYLSKHGEYLLSIDIHDIYTFGIYTVVFLLWIFWFEKISDLNFKKQKD